MLNNNTLTNSQINNTEQNQVQHENNRIDFTLIEVKENGMVSARNLYKFLELADRQFNRWISKNLLNNELVTIGTDYIQCDTMSQVDFFLSIEFAKELAMMARTVKGKQARNYFLECEKKANQLQLPQNYKEALLALIKAEEEKEAQTMIIQEKNTLLELQAPKVELASNYLENGDNMNLSTTAKALRIKVSDLTNLLYSKYIFDQRGNKVPYAEYLDWFYCKPFVAQNGHKGTQLLVTPLGFEKLSKLITKPNLLEKITNLFK